jgi:hypothetical protein
MALCPICNTYKMPWILGNENAPILFVLDTPSFEALKSGLSLSPTEAQILSYELTKAKLSIDLIRIAFTTPHPLDKLEQGLQLVEKQAFKDAISKELAYRPIVVWMGKSDELLGIDGPEWYGLDIRDHTPVKHGYTCSFATTAPAPIWLKNRTVGEMRLVLSKVHDFYMEVKDGRIK